MELKKGLIGLLVCGMVLAGNTQAQAASLTDSYVKKEERSLLDDVESVKDTSYSIMRNSHLGCGIVELTKVSPTRVGVFGTTQAVHNCDEIHLNLYLDRYDVETDTWNEYRSWEFSDEDTDFLTADIVAIVHPEYYYSIRGYHICIHGEVMETTFTMTHGLYIGKTDKPVERKN